MVYLARDFVTVKYRLRACSSAIREVPLELQCLCLPLPTTTTCVSFFSSRERIDRCGFNYVFIRELINYGYLL